MVAAAAGRGCGVARLVRKGRAVLPGVLRLPPRGAAAHQRPLLLPAVWDLLELAVRRGT